MFAISLWLIVQAYQSYFSYPVITNIRKYVDQEHLFPAVTICNLEPLLSKTASDYIEKYLPNDFNYTLENLEKLIRTRKGLLDLMSGNHFNFEEKKLFGYSIDETIINCMFNGTLCSNFSQEFIWYYSYKYANCFTYNSGFVHLNESKETIPVKTVSRDGVEYGLSLELYVGSRDARYSLEQYGAIVFIHNQSSLPESSSGIILKPGTQTNVVIEKNFNSYTPSPYSECQDLSTLEFDRTYYETILQASLTYTQSICLDLCLRQQIIKKCNCSYLEFIEFHDSVPCSTDSEIKCAQSLFDLISFESSLESCSSIYHCPLEVNKYSAQIFGVFMKASVTIILPEKTQNCALYSYVQIFFKEKCVRVPKAKSPYVPRASLQISPEDPRRVY